MITPDSLAPINMGLLALSMQLDRLARHPEHQAEIVTDMRDAIKETRTFVRTLQGVKS